MTQRKQQWKKLQHLLKQVMETNAFYRMRLPLDFSPKSLEAFVKECPLMTKEDLVRNRQMQPPYGTNLTWPLARYTRFSQTSGTTGKPLAWLDTPEDWGKMLEAWQLVFQHSGVEAGRDRIFFAFSFGPFLGFWTAYEAAVSMGFFCAPGGSLSTTARLQLLNEHEITVLCGTPTYAIRLGEAREELQVETKVRVIIVAGEPGGSIPATRARLEALWPGARVYDHHGLTEAGPVTYEVPGHSGRLQVIEDAYFAEVLDPETGREVADGEKGELVLTTLDRLGCPLLRFRTGDLVMKKIGPDGELCLEGGIIGRLDDMVVVRGVNIYPSAVEGVLRRFSEVVEYQVREDWSKGMLELHLVIELVESAKDPKIAGRIETALQDSLGLRMPVQLFPSGSLPRFEFKSRRWIKAPVQEKRHAFQMPS
jgi:phenylacetate-CoA ligase